MSEPPNLLLLTPSNGFGGGIERVADAIEHAWPAGFERVDLYRRSHTSTQAGQPAAKLGFAARALATGIRQRPGIVLALHAGLLPVAHVVGAVTRSETAVVGIGLEVWASMRATRRRSIRRCDRLLAISTFTARWMARRAQLPPERITVVPLPVDAELARRTGGAPDPERSSEPSFLTVSRVVAEHRYKGHFAIAHALPLVLEQEPRARWIVIGAGDDLENLREECERLGVDHAVELRGEVDDGALAGAFREAQFLVLPSVADAEADPPTGEGLGLVYLEAGMFGLPSIAAREGGGALDFVEHETTGLVVEGDRDALAAAIIRLLRDAAYTARLGDAALSRVAARHSPEQFLATLEAALTSPDVRP